MLIFFSQLMLLHSVMALIKKPNQGGIGMADVTSTVQNAASGVVGVIKALIVLFVFVNIIYSTGFDPIGGIVDLNIFSKFE